MVVSTYVSEESSGIFLRISVSRLLFIASWVVSSFSLLENLVGWIKKLGSMFWYTFVKSVDAYERALFRRDCLQHLDISVCTCFRWLMKIFLLLIGLDHFLP